MALKQRGEYWYGDSHEDLRTELLRYSRESGYPVHHFADAVCTCGGRVFAVQYDEDEGVAVRTCAACKKEHAIGDSEEYLEAAELEGAECLCEEREFEVTVGVSLYEGSEDVRWLYLGCRCVKCGLLGCYADWKNEYNGYQALLAKV
jgi:hypothetical protein